MGAPNELSFLPDDYLERKARRRTNAICAILFCVVIGAIGSAFWVTEKSMREIDQQYTTVINEYNDAAKRIEQVQKMQEKQRTMATQAELTASLLEKVPRSFVLAELTNAMPQGVSLLDFQLDAKVSNAPPPAAPKTAFELRQAEVNGAAPGAPLVQAARPRVYDVSMRATGIALTDVQVAQFISKLNVSKMFTDVNLVFTDELAPGQKEDKLRKFQLELNLSPNATVDVENPQKKLSETATLPLGNQ